MFIQESQRVIDAFLNRFVMEVDIEGPDEDFTMMTATISKDNQVKVFFAIRDYAFCVYFDDNDELHIEVDGQSVFDYADENGWDDKFIECVKHGKEKGKENDSSRT